MKVDIWSDIRCPFCYMGKRKFEKAMAQFPQKDKVEVEWHSFELDPGIKTQAGVNIYDYLAGRKNITRESSVQLHRHVTETAKEVGLDYHFDTAVIANSFDAHRLIQLAKLNGMGDAAEERLFKAYFTEGKDISDHLTLIILGDEIGLDGRLVKKMLDSDALMDEVRYDERQARELGINAVPFFVINDRYGVSGAQQPEVFLQTLERAWQEYEQEHPELKLATAG
ncbi:MAG: DsbA family oxidoreductase [Chitinophagales bacterium]